MKRTFLVIRTNAILFYATKPNGLGSGYLYISFKNSEGSWTTVKNMEPLINSRVHEFCWFVSKDGKYSFFTGNQHIYWVNATILESFKS